MVARTLMFEGPFLQSVLQIRSLPVAKFAPRHSTKGLLMTDQNATYEPSSDNPEVQYCTY
jgi:hypothetical protein